jgi:hypothetical protein
LNIYFDEVDPPEAPYNLQPPNNEIIEGTVPHLSWTAGARSCAFDVYLDTVNPPQKLVSSKQAETTFQPSGLDATTNYYWKVVAWNVNGSASSDVQGFETGVPLIGSYDTPFYARGVYVNGSYVSIAAGASGLEIISVFN